MRKPSQKGTAPAQGKGMSAARLGKRPNTGRWINCLKKQFMWQDGGGGVVVVKSVSQKLKDQCKPRGNQWELWRGGNTEEELRPLPAGERHLGQPSRLPPLQTTEDQRSIYTGSWHVWTCNVLISSLVVCSPILTTRKSRAWCRL